MTAQFERAASGRLQISGELGRAKDGKWWVRPIEGVLADGRHVLVLWRNRPGRDDLTGSEEDNLVLDAWLVQAYRGVKSRFATIYVNGDSRIGGLPGLESTQVSLIEGRFFELMFAPEGL